MARRRAPAGRAAEGDRVFQICPEQVGDALANDDAVGGGLEAAEVAFEQLGADGGDARLLFGFDAEILYSAT